MIELPEESDLSKQTEKVEAEVYKPFREGDFPKSEESANQIELSVQRLREIEGLRDENWGRLDEFGRRAVLEAAGREVADVYDHPAPPLHIQDMHDPALRGTYGDGFRSGHDGELEGADYKISMNSEGHHLGEGVLGDDPRPALETYLHEFRHSYQHEQINRLEKPQCQNLVNDHGLAREWSDNLQDYRNPELDFESYFNQPVESDARDFADQIVTRLLPESDENGKR